MKTLNSKNLEDILIIINSDNLEKKSKLRSFFEKNKKLVCVPFYPDNEQTLSKLAYNFLRRKKNFNLAFKYKHNSKQMHWRQKKSYQ